MNKSVKDDVSEINQMLAGVTEDDDTFFTIMDTEYEKRNIKYIQCDGMEQAGIILEFFKKHGIEEHEYCLEIDKNDVFLHLRCASNKGGDNHEVQLNAAIASGL